MRFLLLLTSALLAFGCAQTPTTNGKGKTDTDFIHIQSGFIFPENLGGLIRKKVREYDKTGHNISISYSTQNAQSIVITIYVFPSPQYKGGGFSSLDAHFEIEREQILENTPGTVQIPWPEDVPMWSDEGVSGILSAYNWRGNNIAVSLLQLYDYGKWRLKFRTTYSVEDKENTKLIDEAHKAFNWSAGLDNGS